MRGFMAGAIKTGGFAESKRVERKSSPTPWANFPMTFAVAGAMSIRSALSVREMWGMSPVDSPPSIGNILWMGVLPVSTSKGRG